MTYTLHVFQSCLVYLIVYILQLNTKEVKKVNGALILHHHCDNQFSPFRLSTTHACYIIALFPSKASCNPTTALRQYCPFFSQQQKSSGSRNMITASTPSTVCLKSIIVIRDVIFYILNILITACSP